MDNEIKEILEKIKNWCDLALDDNCNTIMYKYEFVAILDYITNLQESEAYYYGQYKDYKSRNEKAIEYIKMYDGEPVLRDYYDRDLLDILQRSDKE